MIQAASGKEWAVAVTDQVVRRPEMVERGFEVLDTALPLGSDLVVDVVLRDGHSNPVLLLVDAEEDGCAGLARCLAVRAEVQRTRALLDRLYRREKITFRDDPRIVLLLRRLSERGLAALRSLGGGVQVGEAALARIGEEDHLVVMRWEGVSMAVGTPSAVSDAPPSSLSSPAPSAAAVLPDPAPAADRPAFAAAPEAEQPVALDRAEGAPELPLIDEAKRRILRISDELEEEVDGSLVRFSLHDEVVAVLAGSGRRLNLYVGDQPNRRHGVGSLGELNVALDDVFRRFFELSSQNSRTSPN